MSKFHSISNRGSQPSLNAQTHFTKNLVITGGVPDIL